MVAAVPGYVLAIARLDRIGHRRLQLIGFAMMALCFAVIGLVPGMTTVVVPFLLVYGVSYFFTEFGPNMTTFVMPSELFPVTHARHRPRHLGRRRQARARSSASSCSRCCRPRSGCAARCCSPPGSSVLGLLLTLVLPEPAGTQPGGDDLGPARQHRAAARRRSGLSALRLRTPAPSANSLCTDVGDRGCARGGQPEERRRPPEDLPNRVIRQMSLVRPVPRHLPGLAARWQ